MAMKSSKAQEGVVRTINLRFDGGLNYSESSSQIADNELARAFNLIYNNQTGTPETRPGTTCVTAAALAAPIRKLYHYEKSPTESWLVCVSGEKLYYLNVDAWVEIGTDAIANTTVVPSFITFNNLMIMADGSTNLRTWDGTTLTALSDGLSATAIAEVGARVVINSTGEPDLVTFSGVEDETMWDTADLTNPAIGLRCGFGDNMTVNAFAVFGTDLIVSKRGVVDKFIYRISTADVPTNWTVSKLTGNNCAQNANSMVTAFNNVFFVDVNGFKSIKGVTEYGDLQIDLTGEKINSDWRDRTNNETAYIPKYNAIWCLTENKIYAYHNVASKPVFSELEFVQGVINSVVQVGDDLYLAGDSGYLYFMDGTAETDEVSPDVTSDYPTLLITKQFNLFGGGILRRTSVELKPLKVVGNNPAYIKARFPDGTKTLLKPISVLVLSEELYDAVGDLNDATTLLGSIAGPAWIENTTNRVRGTSLQWQIDSQSGRFGVETLQAEIALVTG